MEKPAITPKLLQEIEQLKASVAKSMAQMQQQDGDGVEVGGFSYTEVTKLPALISSSPTLALEYLGLLGMAGMIAREASSVSAHIVDALLMLQADIPTFKSSVRALILNTYESGDATEKEYSQYAAYLLSMNPMFAFLFPDIQKPKDIAPPLDYRFALAEQVFDNFREIDPLRYQHEILSSVNLNVSQVDLPIEEDTFVARFLDTMAMEITDPLSLAKAETVAARAAIATGNVALRLRKKLGELLATQNSSDGVRTQNLLNAGLQELSIDSAHAGQYREVLTHISPITQLEAPILAHITSLNSAGNHAFVAALPALSNNNQELFEKILKTTNLQVNDPALLAAFSTELEQRSIRAVSAENIDLFVQSLIRAVTNNDPAALNELLRTATSRPEVMRNLFMHFFEQASHLDTETQQSVIEMFSNIFQQIREESKLNWTHAFDQFQSRTDTKNELAKQVNQAILKTKLKKSEQAIEELLELMKQSVYSRFAIFELLEPEQQDTSDDSWTKYDTLSRFLNWALKEESKGQIEGIPEAKEILKRVFDALRSNRQQ